MPRPVTESDLMKAAAERDLYQQLAHAAAIHMASHQQVSPELARQMAERDRVIAQAMQGGSGLPCTESYLFGEMACAAPADDTPPSPLLTAVRGWVRNLFNAMFR